MNTSLTGQGPVYATDRVGSRYKWHPSWPWPATAGWRFVSDVPVEIATKFDPRDRAWTSEQRDGIRSIVYDVGEDWWRAVTDAAGNVYYQHWSALDD